MVGNMHGVFHWNELRARDVEKAKKYYSDLLGWTYEEVKMEEDNSLYYLCKSGDQIVAGMFQMSEAAGFPPDVPSNWLPYIEVDDIDKRLEIAKSEGSEIFFGPMDVKDVGRFAVVLDGAGAVVGLITPVKC